MAVEEKEKQEIEQKKLERAICARLQHFKEQADELTLEAARRLLEKDLGLQKFALDAHKRFIMQFLEKNLSKTPEKTTNKMPLVLLNKNLSRTPESTTNKMPLVLLNKTPVRTTNKRPLEDPSIVRPRKTPFGHVKAEEGLFNETKVFKFRILMPNSTALELKISELRAEMPIEEFLDVVKKEYFTVIKQRSSQPIRKINWKYQDLHFTDLKAKKIRTRVDFGDFLPNEWHILCLHDGSPEPDTYEGMWDLTPDTDLLKELPDDYTFETALADLIDNSLQALWSNGIGEDKVISVEWHPDRISIFDSGPGMDGTDGNLVKWGKMGASLHRSARRQAVGGKPPYLTPFFGMFGYGGPVAAMCLGRRAVVSSKTKTCNKVFTLHLEREALLNASRSENCWRTKGGMRDPSKDEKKKSRHGSFTKVEIFEPKMKIQDVKCLQCKLKDIYFPYIQFDDTSGKTRRLIDFEVNGEELAEIWGGEVATTNSHSCNGPDFTVQLHLSISQDPSSAHGQSQRVPLQANARLKCVYFPIVEGKESINTIINELKDAGWEIRESFESFSRVAVRRLGRLLPDTRWALLPFMEPKQKVGEKAKILKRCCSRVKCFIDTDAGFNPTPHKTDLTQHHPYTKALKNFGNRAPENEEEVQIEITRDGKKLTLPQLEKQYAEWISEMHDRYDEEVDRGLDEATLVIVSSKIKNLDTSSGVLRVHKQIQRRGKCWTAGQKVKILKGACAGVHSNNLFATLEYIVLEGLQGDAGGEARLICRPIGLPEDRGCHLLNENGNKTIDIRDSLALPIRVIDSEKCLQAEKTEWENKLHTYYQKLPSAINLLSHIDCQELEIEGGLPSIIEAGDAPPDNIVAVIRPKAYNSGKSPKSLDQKFIVRVRHEMSLEVKFSAGDKDVGNYDHVYSVINPPSSHKGLHGLYLFSLKLNRPPLFEKAGFYKFFFSVSELKDVWYEQVVQVQASAEVGSWKVVSHTLDEPHTIRVGCCFEPLAVACYDRYDNCIIFTSVPKLTINLSSNSRVLARLRSMKVDLTTDKSIMKLEDIVVKTDKLDDIRPNYEATLDISTLDDAFSVAFPCRVLPGTPRMIVVHPRDLRKQLIPGQVIAELMLEVYDEYGNHAKEGENILFSVDGFSFQDGSNVVNSAGDYLKKVNANGYVDLSNILKVTKGFDKDVSLGVISEEKIILKLNFQTEKRKLRSVTKVFKNREVGSTLENIVFEIIDSEGKVDESIHDEEKHGQTHTLTIKSNSFDIDDSIRYSFRRGRCTIRSIPLPRTEGTYSFSAVHSRYPELNFQIEVHVKKALEENHDFTVNHEDVGNPVLSPRFSCENSQIPPPSPLLKDIRALHKDFSPLILKGYVSPIGYSSSPGALQLEDINARSKNFDTLPVQVSASQGLENLKELEDDHVVQGSRMLDLRALRNDFSPLIPHIGYSPLKLEDTNAQNKNLDILPVQVSASQDLDNLKELEDDLAVWGSRMLDHRSKLKWLNNCQSEIQQQISDLQASMACSANVSSMCGQEWTQEQIKSKNQSAAAVVCKLFGAVPFESRPPGILGVVALLGTTESIELSRMLAKYLGEDLMLAIVCENYAAAYDLESSTLHELASKVGQSISGGYQALCLDDIRLDITVPSIGPQNLLHLQPPTLPGVGVPQGFKGYAVNLITIESSYLQFRTKTGHGLRETLFYRVFGELQVYEDKECMMMAQSCIKDGAVSLDGGIIRNGLVSLGQWEPVIIFPVQDRAFTPQSSRTRQLLEVKKLELMDINRQIDERAEYHDQDNEEFVKSLDRYNSYRLSQDGRLPAARDLSTSDELV